MNHIYNTRGYVLASFPSGEYNKQLVLLTEQFGVIRVTAQAVRKIESKLRTSIQDYSYAEFFLVHGKSGWRLTNTTHIENIHSEIPDKDFLMIARIFSLIMRLIPEEDNASKVFSVIDEVIAFIKENALDAVGRENLEILATTKILADLGYIEHHEEIMASVAGGITQATIAQIGTHKKEAIKIVNQAIRESHL